MLPHAVYESVFASSPIGQYLLSPSDDPVILAVNDAFLQASGRSRQSLLGHRLFDAFPSDPQDPGDTGVASLRASLVRVLATGRADPLPLQRYPIRVTHADGTEAFEERYWQAVSTPIYHGQALVCIAHRTEDVTQQTRTAAALRRVTDLQRFQLKLADRLRELTSPEQVTSTASAMLGQKLRIARVTYVEVDDPSGTFVQRHWVHTGEPTPADERRHLDDFGPEIIATLRSGMPLVIRDVRTDPRTMAHAAAYASIGVRSNLAIPLVKSGRLTIVLSLQHHRARNWTEGEIQLAMDVAERTWAAAENARAQEELHEANRRKDEFLAMLAHELRNPLAPISVAADLLARRELDPAHLHKTSAIIARQVRHMTALVDDLLDVSRVTRGLVTLQLDPQDMKTVAAHAVEQARPLIERHRHHLTLDLPPGPAGVCGDAKRLVQVLSNLLNNAAKYTPPGGRINVSVEVDDTQVRVHVKDNGIGIAENLQPRIFELFAQAERAPDRSQGGLGLGLALVRSMVELHRGTVKVYSAGLGAGSCFTVTLPRFDSAGQFRADTRPAPLEIEPAHSLDVLVVDDNADAAEMLKLLLEDAGHRVHVEHDPALALQWAALHPPQAGFIDIGLPGMDGYELVRRLRAAPATVGGRYVALTGYGQETDRGKALDAGFDEHIVKPADPNRLLAALDGLRPASPDS